MKRVPVFLAVVLICGGLCVRADDAVAPADFSVYSAAIAQVTSPRAIPTSAEFMTAFPAAGKPPKNLADFKRSKSAILAELVNHDVYVRAYSIETDGKLTYLVGCVAGKGKQIVVQQDYLNYKLVQIKGKQEKVGIVFRIEAELVTKSSDVNLNGLFAIGLAVQSGSAAGQLKVEVHGLAGEPISSLIPLPSDISEASLQNAMQAIATLKTKVYDDQVTVSPQIIAD
jgi:hypothetical protein